MTDNQNQIEQRYNEIGDLLNLSRNINSETISHSQDIEYAWYVGATGNNAEGNWQDFSEQFLNEDRWENLSAPEYYTDVVNQIQPGDRIAIKASYTRKNNLPFDNNNKFVGVLSIKAIGTVLENSNDGRNIKVNWQKVDPIREWYGPGAQLRSTIHLVKAENGYIYKSLLDFTFNNGAQDYSICIDKYSDNEKEEVSETTQEMEQGDLTNIQDLPIRQPRTNKDPLNFILYGAPGTGKTYSTAEYALSILENRPVDLSRKTPEARKLLMQNYNNYIKQGRIVFTTFHQNYSYEDFIQGLRPVSENGLFSFKPIDGVFKKISDKAMYDNNNPYVIIIDEINRANISKVFGELITLIEDDKRWGEINEMSVTLPSGDIFAIPNNLYIIGTMNSADKSISLIDAALRRRFKFIEQHPNTSLITDTTLKVFLESLNKILAEELDSTDLLIGHSYFINHTQSDLCEILNNSIIPLLYEYFYDNKKKVANILSKVLERLSIEICDNKISRLFVKETENDSESL